MKKVNVSKFNVNELLKNLNECDSDDFNEVGLYKVYVGGRGCVEEVCYVGLSDEIEVCENDDELISNIRKGKFGGDDEFSVEFVGVYNYEVNGKIVYGVSMFEELSYEYFYVN